MVKAGDEAETISFNTASNARAAPSDNATHARSCDERRKELQEAFTKAVKKIRELINADAKERIKDETCSETASPKKSTAMVPLTSQHEQAAPPIQYANAAMALNAGAGLWAAESSADHERPQAQFVLPSEESERRWLGNRSASELGRIFHSAQRSYAASQLTGIRTNSGVGPRHGTLQPPVLPR